MDNAAAGTQPSEPPSPSFLAAQLLSQATPPGTGGAYLLSYERQLVQEMIEEDALCIMSTGMGWQKVRWAEWGPGFRRAPAVPAAV